jgi:hypothetical protein
VNGQPTFRWTPAEGAEVYRLQVAADPTFGSPLDDVTTAAASYTPVKTYPVDTLLYWRVRAIDGSANGLTWSPTRTFRRRLSMPVTDPGNPTGGSTIPVLSWLPVQGASGYQLHVEQPDGTRKDFSTQAAAFTPVTHYGTGVWRWQVRAVFPGNATGPYTGLAPFTRAIPAPAHAQARRSKKRILLSWDPAEMARSYRVEVSDTTSFASTIESATTDLTSWAPDLSRLGYVKGGTLYWRVATTDEGRNVGAFASGQITLRRKLVVSAAARLKHRMSSVLVVRVSDLGRSPVRKAVVRITGGGVKRVGRTDRNGSVTLRVTPRRKGHLRITATKRGYVMGRTRLKVR